MNKKAMVVIVTVDIDDHTESRKFEMTEEELREELGVVGGIEALEPYYSDLAGKLAEFAIDEAEGAGWLMEQIESLFYEDYGDDDEEEPAEEEED